MEALLWDTTASLVDTDQPSSRAVPKAARQSSWMRIINTSMRELSSVFARSEPIAFYCECRDPTCFSAVWVAADVFDATVIGRTGWVLLEGHEPSALWHTREPAPAPGDNRARRRLSKARHRAPLTITPNRRDRLGQLLPRAT